MVSVGLTWAGTCKRQDESELIEFLGAIAELNDNILIAAKDLLKDHLLEVIVAARRKLAGPARPNIVQIDDSISEPILIDESVFSDVLDFEEATQALKAPIARIKGAPKQESAYVLNLHGPNSSRALCLQEGASLRGIDFRVFDPRELYPGEDRASFVFLRSEHAALDGRVCAAFHRSKCPGLVRFEDVKGADWFLTRPQIHLRYFLEEWFDLLLSVIKFFFMPDLYFWRHEALSGYAKHSQQFRQAQVDLGPSTAKAAAIDEVIEGFIAEIRGWALGNQS